MSIVFSDDEGGDFAYICADLVLIAFVNLKAMHT
jgi:hypothetical protein